jgi:hypothetical protein
MAVPTVHLLDYVAGNVRSLVNAIERLGFNVEWIKEPADVSKAEVRDQFLNISIPAIHMSNQVYNCFHRNLFFLELGTLVTVCLNSLPVGTSSPSVNISSQASRFWEYVWGYRRFLKALKRIQLSLA